MAKTSPKKNPVKSKSKPTSYTTLDFTPGFWGKRWKEALIIPLLAFALYWMCLPYGYVLDDQIVITDNKFTQKGVDGIWEILSTESFTGYFGGQKTWWQVPGTDPCPSSLLLSNKLSLGTIPLSATLSTSCSMAFVDC